MVRTLAQNAILDTHIAATAERAFALLERLVAQPSTLGRERGAQEELAAALQRLGFAIEWLAIPEAIADDPAAGIPALPYDGRAVLVARLPGTGGGRSLLLNGHLDVVPAGDLDLWAHDPFEPVRRDGWLSGRGAGDMKAGWAMAVLALEALLETGGRPAGDLVVVGTIEEECTGNGTLASVRAGITADAALLPEPTDLDVLLQGVGVLWVDVTVRGRAGHALATPEGVGALDGAWDVIGALRDLARSFDDGGGAHHHVNVGTLVAGDWRSTVPGSSRLGVRIGFPAGWTAAQAQERVREAVADAAAASPWLADGAPVVHPSGFRAEGYALAPDAPLAVTLRRAHADAHGRVPADVSTDGTTDARYYLNQAGVPAVCYGPRTRNMHGADEAVELASIVDGARTVARFLDQWLGAPA